jgi:hypothetical protein
MKKFLSLFVALAMVFSLFTGVGARSAKAVAGTDATLSALTPSAGTLDPTFDPTTGSYSVVLPYGTTIVPTVTATPTDNNAGAAVIQPTSVTGSAIVLVTAEDTSTY